MIFFSFLETNGRAWCPSRHGLGHPSCPPAMSQGKLRKRNKTGCSVLTKSATKTISKRTQAKSPVCGQCAWAAARWPNASEQRQKLTENLTKNCDVPEPPPRVSEGGSSFLTNQKILQSCRATRGILRVCVRKQIQAEASQKGGGAAHLAPQSLLPVPAAGAQDGEEPKRGRQHRAALPWSQEAPGL